MGEPPTAAVHTPARAPHSHLSVAPEVGAGVLNYRNLRYATAGRFALPVVESRITGAPDPTARYACPQAIPTEGPLVEAYRALTLTEDCQVLSVRVPADLGPRERVPVMVWVHGGSYLTGAGDLSLYDADALVREGRVAVVTVTFRLGAFGFAGGGDRPPNLGIHDLIAALTWIHQHIAYFGGNPDQVTLFGQSSGADAVAHLMLAASTEGLFQRAIVQSAPFGVRGRRAGMEQMLSHAMNSVPPDAPAEELVAIRHRLPLCALRFGLRLALPFAPQYGAAPLPPEGEIERAWRERAKRVEVMVGWTRDEAAFFLGGLPAFLGRWLMREGLGSAVRTRLVDRLTAAVYRRGGEEFADLLGSSTRASYQVEWSPTRAGAMHAIELPLLFPSPTAWRGVSMIGEVPPQQLVHVGAPLRAAWTAFARGEGAPAGDIELPDGSRIAVTAPH